MYKLPTNHVIYERTFPVDTKECIYDCNVQKQLQEYETEHLLRIEHALYPFSLLPHIVLCELSEILPLLSTPIPLFTEIALETGVYVVDPMDWSDKYLSVPPGSSLIMRVTDTSSPWMMDFLFALSTVYDRMMIVKPSVCDVYHKYVVCEGFHLPTGEKMDFIPLYFEQIMNEINVIHSRTVLDYKQKCVYSLLHFQEEKIRYWENKNQMKCRQWIQFNKSNLPPHFLSDCDLLCLNSEHIYGWASPMSDML